ncbi:MAG: T9SS type A sorting domain-containing protein [Melioribacteraceae bacterium]|nr:T9SS type A sorting domain-containing protein [Melioribacteraceae bacterium]
MSKLLLIIFTIMLLALTPNVQAGIGEGQSTVGPLPVELTSFSAIVKSTSTGSATNVVLLSWTTATEVNNYGFEIQRRTNLRGLANLEGFETIGFVNGHGNSNSPKDYSYVDPNLLSGNTSYRLKQIDTDGKFEYSQIIELKSNLTKEYVLRQNYPNPFNPTTVISYSIPKASFVTIKVYDVLGNVISTLVSKTQNEGSYKLNFDATNLSNGVYFYKLTTNQGFTDIKKMLLLK